MNDIRATVALVAAVAAVPLAVAAVFPDIPDGHMYQKAVETLVHANVIKGNPDGKFYPDRDVNRAEMLKMLYIARGKVPDPLSIRCFPDVGVGSWYEPYVCDAAARRFVNGYSDGTFRPSDSVNRVEALKMISEVFEIPVNDVSEADRDLVKFVDVSVAAWYTKYLYAAFYTGILPIPGQDGSRFYPEWPLKRGEAAAYIFNALNVDLQSDRAASSSRPGRSTSASSAQQIQNSSSDLMPTGTSSSAGPSVIEMRFPFESTGKFSNKNTVSYRFDVTEASVMKATASPQTGQPGNVSCQLYLLSESGFSDQYFLSYQNGRSCEILAAVSPGRYQLQLQPSEKNTTFSVTAAVGTGDGNDGFRQAKGLTVNSPRSEILAADDLEDWFTFKLNSEQRMNVTLSNAAELRCIVYAMNDVNLASFQGPACNSMYTYPPGTYYIAVGRKAPIDAQQTFTIQLEK
ncbi:S-layer homology domain-containing protein [Candidatus Peregrinibacteria bacterium]|nr:S-layer homology domain-containing protein [Candidatus Peregrinibacteria bacterium]